MSDLTKLGEVLANQSTKYIKSQDYDDVREFTMDVDDSNNIVVHIESVQVGFVFDTDHRFVGIFNWKD